MSAIRSVQSISTFILFSEFIGQLYGGFPRLLVVRYSDKAGSPLEEC